MHMSPPLEASISNEQLPSEEVLWSGSPGSKKNTFIAIPNVRYVEQKLFMMLHEE